MYLISLLYVYTSIYIYRIYTGIYLDIFITFKEYWDKNCKLMDTI